MALRFLHEDSYRGTPGESDFCFGAHIFSEGNYQPEGIKSLQKDCPHEERKEVLKIPRKQAEMFVAKVKKALFEEFLGSWQDKIYEELDKNPKDTVENSELVELGRTEPYLWDIATPVEQKEADMKALLGEDAYNAGWQHFMDHQANDVINDRISREQELYYYIDEFKLSKLLNKEQYSEAEQMIRFSLNKKYMPLVSNNAEVLAEREAQFEKTLSEIPQDIQTVFAALDKPVVIADDLKSIIPEDYRREGFSSYPRYVAFETSALDKDTMIEEIIHFIDADTQITRPLYKEIQNGIDALYASSDKLEYFNNFRANKMELNQYTSDATYEVLVDVERIHRHRTAELDSSERALAEMHDNLPPIFMEVYDNFREKLVSVAQEIRKTGTSGQSEILSQQKEQYLANETPDATQQFPLHVKLHQPTRVATLQ